MRLPAPLAFAKSLASRTDPTAEIEAPFVKAVDLGARWAHRLDTEAVTQDRSAFLFFLAEADRLEGPSGPIDLEPVSAAIGSKADLPAFTTPEEARVDSTLPDVSMAWVGDAASLQNSLAP